MDKAAGNTDPILHISPFDQWLLLPGEWVEEPNVKRGGRSGVQRIQGQDGRTLYAKQQINYGYRSLRHPLGEPTVLREKRALLALTTLGIGVPELIYCGVRKQEGQWEALLITAALEGFESLQDCYARGVAQQWSDTLRERIFRQLGQLLARLHRARWQHGALYDNHLFVRIQADERVELALLDLEKSRRRLFARLASRHDMEKLRRHSAWGLTEWVWLEHSYQEGLQQA